MHVGIATGFQHQSSDELADNVFLREDLEMCVLGEELGFESVWITEHHFSNYSLSPAPLQTLAYLAGRTRKMRFGTQVIVLPWNDPVRVAEQIILLDHFCGGRAIVGLGRGLGKMEYEGMRVDINETRQRFQEYSQLVLKALDTGFIEGGELPRQPRRELRPRPFKSFRGRVFGSAGSPESVRTVATLGMGVMIINPEPRKHLGVDFDTYHQVWKEVHGATKQAPRPLLSGTVFVDESRDRARELSMRYHKINFRGAVRNYGMAEPDFGTSKGNEFYKRMRINEADIDKMAEDMAGSMPAGTPQDVLEIYERHYRDSQLQGIFPHFHFGGMPREMALANMQLFARECLGEIKSWPVVSSLDGEPAQATA
jgi:alkanesulfonate monooxygenase SsuD/methylene tetrahydromethanopterin reductase-like flavin-dependent oxidoreductase (luciferase family)